MTPTATKMLEMLDADQAERAKRLLDEALRSRGVTRPELAAALERGLGCALYSAGHPAAWGNEKTDPAAHLAGRLLRRIAHEMALPLGRVEGGPSAVGVIVELLG